MSKKENKIKGNLGEDIACKYLEKLDYKIVARNFSCFYGEVDIIAIQNNEIVFVEVKTKCQSTFGAPIDAIDKYKTYHIYNTAKYYLYKANMLDSPIRFDAIEIYLYSSESYKISHFKKIIIEEP